MPSYFLGSKEDRLARMDKNGLRCDGNSRDCPRTAVEEFDLWTTDGFGNKTTDSRKVTKKACGRHRLQFERNGFYVMEARRPIQRPTGPRGYRSFGAANARFSTSDADDQDNPMWLTFVNTCNAIQPGMFGRPIRTDGWHTDGSMEEYADARVIFRNDETVQIISKSEAGNVAMMKAGKRLGVRVHG